MFVIFFIFRIYYRKMSLKFFVFGLLFTLFYHQTNGLGFKQAAGAKGQLTCKGKPASGIKIKMYDNDRGVDTDDFMAETKTDSDGKFELSGTAKEFGSIDPKINIYHNCNDGKPCDRKVTIFIDKKYVTHGKTPKEFADVGKIELENKFSGEKRDCFNFGK